MRIVLAALASIGCLSCYATGNYFHSNSISGKAKLSSDLNQGWIDLELPAAAVGNRSFDRDLYIRVAGTPAHFRVDFVNLYCTSSGHLLGHNPIVFYVNAGKMRVASQGGRYMSRMISIPFLTRRQDWMFSPLSGADRAAYQRYLSQRAQGIKSVTLNPRSGKPQPRRHSDLDVIGQAICTDQYRRTMARYRLINVNATHPNFGVFNVTSSGRFHARIEWDPNWTPPTKADEMKKYFDDLDKRLQKEQKRQF